MRSPSRCYLYMSLSTNLRAPTHRNCFPTAPIGHLYALYTDAASSRTTGHRSRAQMVRLTVQTRILPSV